MRRQPTKQTETKAAAKPVWSVPVAITDVPETGRHVELIADAAVREAIANMAALVALPRLEATFDLKRQGDDSLRAVGRVVADVVQTCVVTLEPVQTEIDEPIDVVFTPETAAAKPSPSFEGEDPPEPLHNGTADLGVAATEFLLLGIDPYPRKPGVAFEAPSKEDLSNRPFAALAALKKPQDPKGS